MILREISERDGWLVTAWQMTYKADWNVVLHMENSMYPFLEKGEVLGNSIMPVSDDVSLTERVNAAENKLLCLAEEEMGSLTIRGFSKILKCPLQVCIYNQTDVCEFYIPKVYFKDYDSNEKKYETVTLRVGRLADSMEIWGHLEAHRQKGN